MESFSEIALRLNNVLKTRRMEERRITRMEERQRVRS